MKRWIKRMVWGFIGLIVLILLLVRLGMGFMGFSDKKALEYFVENKFEGTIDTITIKDLNVKVISSKPNPEDSILIVFAHGAPGSWDAFKQYLVDEEIKKNARVIAYDRPGYGGSDQRDMPGIEEQTDVLKEIIRRYGVGKTMLVGHSYGGPIVGLCALDANMEIDAAIMIAPLLDPASEPIFWYSYFSYWNWSKWMLPKPFIVAGSEKFAHSKELSKIEEKWEEATSKMIHVHGLKDALAPGKENIQFSKKNIPDHLLEQIVYDDKGHLIIWTEYEMMKAIILDEKSEL